MLPFSRVVLLGVWYAVCGAAAAVLVAVDVDVADVGAAFPVSESLLFQLIECALCSTSMTTTEKRRQIFNCNSKSVTKGYRTVNSRMWFYFCSP